MSKLSFLLRRAAPFKRPIILIAALTLLASFATLAIPFFLARLLGAVVQPEMVSLQALAYALIAALTIMTALNIAASIVSARTGLCILAQLRVETQTHIQSLPVAFHETNRKGDLLALMSYEVTLLSGFFTGSLAKLPAHIFTALGAVVLLFLIDPIMALFVPFLAIMLITAHKLWGRRIWKYSKQAQAADAALVWEAERALELAPAIKSFAAEDAFAADFKAAAQFSQKRAFAQERLHSVTGPLTSLIAGICVLILLVVAGDRITGASRDPAELFAFILYAALLTRPLGGLVAAYADYKRAQGTLQRLDDVLAMPSEDGLAQTDEIDLAKSGICFDQVSFTYRGREQTLDDVSFTITSGEIIALTGDNGAGKSTIIRLLLRFYVPDSGQITIGGKAIEELNVQALRTQIGYVPQRALLFDGTIAENIAFGREDISDAAIERAIQMAEAADFIASLPGGLETQIGDNGVRLSGGQRQRIALARALVSDPPMLILDEATSMYDSASETSFVDNCKQAFGNRTVIIITHREASLALASRVLHVAKGKMTEI